MTKNSHKITWMDSDVVVTGYYLERRPATNDEPAEGGFIDEMEVFFQGVDITPVLPSDVLEQIGDQAWNEYFNGDKDI